MTWLPITDAVSGNACPRCKRGALYVRNSRRTGPCWQLRYLWCSNCPATFKARVDRRRLNRSPKVV